MTNQAQSDTPQNPAGIFPNQSLLSSDDQLLAGIRVTRAQFAKMMDCSRQAVTDWVQSGRIIIGSDGRFDPRRAVAGLLRTGDPAKLRARALMPLANELATYRAKIAELEAAIATLSAEAAQLHSQNSDLAENRDFAEGSANEFAALFDELLCQLKFFWLDLAALDGREGFGVIDNWMESALMLGAQNIPPMRESKTYELRRAEAKLNREIAEWDTRVSALMHESNNHEL